MMSRIFGAALAAALLIAPGTDGPAIAPRVQRDVVFTGRVTDASTGAGLSGVRVTVDGESVGAVSRGGGSYLIQIRGEGLLGREVTLRAELVGYALATRTVRVEAGSMRVDFALLPAAVTLPSERSVREDYRGRPMAQDAIGSVGAAAPASIAAGVRKAAEGARELPGRYNWNFNTEAYDRIVDNPFLSADGNPLSTFSIDVDRASYSNIRRFVASGSRPPKDAVRIEEMINYFPYAYPAPRRGEPFSITTELSAAPWRPEHRLLRIGIQGKRVETAHLPPSNLVFLLDVSGSMQSPDKLPLLKASLRMLVNELRSVDRVAIVVYAGAAGLVLESTPGDRKDVILDALEGLEAGGSTAGGAGIRLAYDVARKNHVRGGNNRVILATDGDFNVGASSDAEMVRLIEEKREQGTFLTVLGFGTGNLKDAKMEKLADHGNGNFAYIDDLLEARKVLVTEIGGTLLTIAKDVKLQIEFNPARVASYRLIGYENRMLRAEDFNDDLKDAGELGAGHSVTALYEIVPVGVESPVRPGTVDSLRYRGDSPRAPRARSGEIAFLKLRYKDPDGSTSRLLEQPVPDRAEGASADLRFASAVAAFGMILRESEHCGSFTLADVVALAKGALGEDPEGYRAGFVHLVDTVRAGELLASGEEGAR